MLAFLFAVAALAAPNVGAAHDSAPPGAGPGADVPLPTPGLTPVPLPPELQIWQGERVGEDELRGVVALVAAGGTGDDLVGRSFCSGTLIGDRWVLTAAHCLDVVRDGVGEGLSLFVGFGDAWPYDRLVAWDAYVVHPRYDVESGIGSGFDMALVELAEAVDEPVVDINVGDLASGHAGLPVTVVGFGVTGEGNDDGGTKRKAELMLVRYERDLALLYNGSVARSPRDGLYYESAWDSTSNACQGDSGGASLVELDDGRQVLVGVNAVVYSGCAGGGTGSTRTDLYVDWVREYVGVGVAEVPPLDPEPDTDPAEVPDTDEPAPPEDSDEDPAGERGCATGGVGTGLLAWVGLLAIRRRGR